LICRSISSGMNAQFAVAKPWSVSISRYILRHPSRR
jgi:hypothetical protein